MRKLKIKLIGSVYPDTFEEEVNKFIQKPNNVLNIEYRPTPYQDRIYYSALITYTDIEE